MASIEVTLKLPEALVERARAAGIVTDDAHGCDDKHLLEIQQYANIPVLNASQFVEKVIQID